MKQHCSGSVYQGRMGSFGCSKPATKEYQGKWWCFQHDPRETEKKHKAWEEAYNQKQREEKKLQGRADALLKRLGVKGSIEYHWKSGYLSAVVISFDEAEKLLKELGR